jgi:glycosyltransferase involved in cell wall biosynthesis
MKVLYIGHYKEGTGWAKSAQNLIKSIHSSGVEIVCRNITLTSDNQVDPLFLQLENNDTNNVDVCIQHVLPHHLVGTTKFKKNIAYTMFESVNIQKNTWIKYLKNMDEVWTPCRDNMLELEKAGIKNAKVVHIPSDIKEYKKERKMEINFSRYGIDSAYKFYTIGEVNKRRNIESTIRAYYSAFEPVDNVVLVLKVNMFGANKNQIFESFRSVCSGIRKSMSKYQNDDDYPNILVIPENFSENEIHNLHQVADCFVSLSHGEAWSLPAFDAMCYGNHPICTGWGGPKEYIDEKKKNTGSLIDYVFEACSNTGAAFKHIFTGREYWANANEMQAAEKMRYYFDNRIKKTYCQEHIEKYSLESVGEKIKEMLNV